jgi:hypothetical protein
MAVGEFSLIFLCTLFSFIIAVVIEKRFPRAIILPFPNPEVAGQKILVGIRVSFPESPNSREEGA